MHYLRFSLGLIAGFAGGMLAMLTLQPDQRNADMQQQRDRLPKIKLRTDSVGRPMEIYIFYTSNEKEVLHGDRFKAINGHIDCTRFRHGIELNQFGISALSGNAVGYISEGVVNDFAAIAKVKGNHSTHGANEFQR